jgi:hypothetical protein
VQYYAVQYCIVLCCALLVLWQTSHTISECEWLDLEEEPNISEEIVTFTKPKYVGWAVLGENVSRKRRLFNVHDTPQTTGDSSKRSLRSTSKS